MVGEFIHKYLPAVAASVSSRILVTSPAATCLAGRQVADKLKLFLLFIRLQQQELKVYPP
jgi:hypothetical protein